MWPLYILVCNLSTTQNSFDQIWQKNRFLVSSKILVGVAIVVIVSNLLKVVLIQSLNIPVKDLVIVSKILSHEQPSSKFTY